MADDQAKKLHIAMFPWLAFGHMIPFLELGKRIAQKGHRISFISTRRNIERLPKIPPELAPWITFVKLPLPRLHNLPENAEATMDVPSHIIPYLKKAHDGLQQPLSHFLQTSAPDWIIHDFAPYWLPPIATKLGISRVFFSIFNAFTWCVLKPPSPSDAQEPENFTVPPKWVPFPTSIAFRFFEAKKIFESFEDNNASGVSDSFRHESVILGAKALAFKTCIEVEGEWLKLLGELHHDNIPHIIPVGLMPPSAPPESGREDNNKDSSTWDTIVEWLDKQENGSVVYIALGSEIQPSQQDLAELALGLEQSGLPFFWALRKPSGSVELPEGFEERTRGRGIVWTGWAPQLRILSHHSVGGFLTHCGWSSVTEAFMFGRALVLLPFLTDQGLIARFLEEKQAGVEVPRNELDGSFTSASLAQTLRLVIKDEEGKIYRDKAKAMTAIFGDKDLHSKYIDKFVEFLENHIKGKD